MMRTTFVLPNVAAGGGGTGLKSSGVLAQSAVPASVTGTVSETVLATIPIPAGAMGLNGVLRIAPIWSYTNSANNKVLRVYFGGVLLQSITRTTTASEDWFFTIRNRGAANSQVRSPGVTPQGGTATAVPTSSVDTSVAQTLEFRGTLANTGETITLEAYIVELLVP